MSRDWLGESFLPIGAQRMGDGQDDTLPHSTALARALWSNTMWLATEPRVISWSPIIDLADDRTDVTGTRPYALLNGWLSILRVPVYVGRGAREIQVWGAWYALTASAQTPEATDDTTLLRVRLWLEGTGHKKSFEIEQTRNDAWTAEQLGRDALSLEFHSVPPGEYLLDIAMKSEIGATIYTSATSNVRLSGLTVEDDDTAPTLFEDQTTGNPDDQSLEVMCCRAGYSALQDYDMVGAIDRSNKIAGASAGHLFEATPISTTNNSAFLREISFLSPRSIALRVRYDRESLVRILPSELRPNIALTGPTATRQAVAIRKLLTRPRVLAVGPQGTLDSADSGYTSRNYRRGWPRMYGDAAETALWSSSVYLTTKNPVLRVRQTLSCLSMKTSVNEEEGGRQKNGKRQVVEHPGQAGWDFRIVVEQLDDVVGGGGTWSANTTQFGELESSRVLRLQPANALVKGPPIARSMAHLFNESDGYSDFAYREGQLVPDAGDYDAVQEIIFDVDLSGLVDADTETPFRVTLYAQHDTAHAENDYMRLDDFTTGLIGPEGWLQLVCAQYSIIERPRESEVIGDLRMEKFLTGQDVLAEDWEAMRDRLHFHWARTGAVIDGVTYDPPFETTSTTLTVVDEGAGGIDLDTWAGTAVMQRLVPADFVAASGRLEPAGNASDGDEVTIGSKTYTLQTTLTDVDGHVQIGADRDESLNNLRAAINLDAGAGTKYASSTTEHPDVGGDAFSSGGVDWLLATADEAGRAGNSIATTTTWTSSDWDDPTLTGGSEGSYLLEFRAYIQDLELQLTWERFDDRTGVGQSGTVTLSSSSGDSEWVVGSVELDEAEAHEGATTAGELAVIYAQMTAKTTGTTGYMWQLGPREEQVDPESYVEIDASLDEWSDLVLWFDASDTSTLWTDTDGTTQVSSDNDNVRRWDNKVPPVDAMVDHIRDASSDWVYQSTGLNSLPTIVKTGEGWMSQVISDANTSEDWTAVWVGAPDSLGSGSKAGPYIFDFTSGRLIFAVDWVDSPGDGPAVYDGSWRRSQSANTLTEPIVLVFRVDGTAGSGEIFRNGTSIGTITYTGVDVGANTSLKVGDGFNSTIETRFSEMGLYDRALSDTEVGEVTDAMKSKWGIS